MTPPPNGLLLDIEQLFIESRALGIRPPTSPKRIASLQVDQRVSAVMRLSRKRRAQAAQACQENQLTAFSTWLHECLSPGFARRTRAQRTARSGGKSARMVRRVVVGDYDANVIREDRARRAVAAKTWPHILSYQGTGSAHPDAAGDTQEGLGRIPER